VKHVVDKAQAAVFANTKPVVAISSVVAVAMPPKPSW
jgi:hypothetical protein